MYPIAKFKKHAEASAEEKQPEKVQEPTDIQIFVLSYDDHSYTASKQYYSKYLWATLLMIPNATKNNPIFENYVYKHYDTFIKPLVTKKYVGFLSYKAHLKINMARLDKYIQESKFLKHDATFFFTSYAKMNSNCHPEFLNIWRDVVEKDLGPSRNYFACYCNFWCCKKEVMQAYVDYFHKILPKLLSHDKIYSDAKYNTGRLRPEQLMDLCSYPHYTHIPFILERIPNAWCTKMNLTVNYKY